MKSSGIKHQLMHYLLSWGSIYEISVQTDRDVPDSKATWPLEQLTADGQQANNILWAQIKWITVIQNEFLLSFVFQ